jgi:hypothetical protein
MKRRRGRRGFWWWSWILALVTIGGVVGGFFYGKKQWENAPKDYLSSAKLSVHIRAPFVGRGAKLAASDGRLANPSEEAFLRDLKSDDALSPIISKLDLSQKWALGTDDALGELRSSVELEYDRQMKQLLIIISRHEPNESAEISNLIANGVAERVKVVDEQQKLEGLKKLELELKPFILEEVEARAVLKKSFIAKGINAEPEPGLSERPYLLDPTILDAHLEWNAALEILEGVKTSQDAFENHWRRPVRPTIVIENAVPPPTFAGPEVEPFQMQFALYGLTFGLIVGSLLSLICWKLFP